MLKIVLPKGSLEKATFELFEAADLAISRSSAVDYKASIDDPRVAEVRILRPQEIPMYVAEGLFDIGITGRDWIVETNSNVESLGELKYSKVTSNPVKVVVAVAGDSPANSVADLPQGVRVTSEYPEMTRRFFSERGINADVRLSYGASEAKIPDIADCVVDITETGRALRAAGLRVIDTILVSYTELIANPSSYADPAKRHAMDQLMTLLNGTLEARTKVLVKLNVSEANYESVLKVLPAAKSPTVSRLASGDYAIESVVEKRTINVIIPALVDAGAKLTIATDNMHADMVEVMRWALAMGRVQRGLVEESWQPEHILRAATEGGADAMGLAGQIGAVLPGYRADMVLLEMRRPHLVPHNDPLGTILHTAHGRVVAHVIVEGEVVVRDGRPTRVDMEEICQKGAAAAEALWRRARGN